MSDEMSERVKQWIAEDQAKVARIMEPREGDDVDAALTALNPFAVHTRDIKKCPRCEKGNRPSTAAYCRNCAWAIVRNALSEACTPPTASVNSPTPNLGDTRIERLERE